MTKLTKEERQEKRQERIDIGAEFLAWAINHQDESLHVGEVMIGPWWKWLDEMYPYEKNKESVK